MTTICSWEVAKWIKENAPKELGTNIRFFTIEGINCYLQMLAFHDYKVMYVYFYAVFQETCQLTKRCRLSTGCWVEE